MRLPREFYIPKGSIAVRDKNSTAVAYLYNAGGKPCAAMFGGKRAKPDHHRSYRSEERRAEHIKEHFAAVQSWESRSKRKTVKRALSVGDVLRCSWGYDQTNVEFFEVTRLVGTASVEIRAIAQEASDTGNLSGQCIPVKGEYVGEPMIKRAQGDRVKIYDFASAYKMEPKKVAGAEVFNASYWSAYA